MEFQAAAILDPTEARAAEEAVSGPASEADLVTRSKTDPEVFAILYRRHYRPIVGYLYRRTGDAHIAEDLAAETFIAAYRGISRYRPTGAAFRFWLLRIATNTTNRWARRQARAGWLARARAIMGARAVDPPHETASDDSERLHRCLSHLPHAQQNAISLHYFEGLSLEESAAVLGCSVGTVKSRLSRARDALRQLLGEESRP